MIGARPVFGLGFRVFRRAPRQGRQDMIAQQRREIVRLRLAGDQPGQFLQLRLRTDGVGQAGDVDIGIDAGVRLVGRRRLEAAEVLEGRGAHRQAQFLQQFAL